MDSSIFLFLRLSPENFALPAAGVLPRFGVPPTAARLAEQNVIQGAFVGAGRNMKTILQLVMAKMLWSDFLPMWSVSTKACEEKYEGSESVAMYGTSACFWLLAIPTLHLVLNTAVYGVAPKRIDKKYGKCFDEEEGGDVSDYGLSPQDTAALSMSLKSGVEIAPEEVWHRIHTAKIPPEFRSDSASSQGSFRIYGFTVSCMTRYCSIAKCFLKSWVAEVDEDDVNSTELELFGHDPRFWQQPWQHAKYFLSQSNGNRIIAVAKYLSTLLWKAKQLIKMTFGYWDQSLIDTMQIKQRYGKLNLAHTDCDAEHEEMLANVGLLHSLVWQLLPFCVFMGKAGEAFNAAPLFVYDDTAKLTVQDAKSLQSVAMDYKNYYKSKRSVVSGQNPMFDDVEDEAEYPASSEQNINPMFRGFEGGGGGGSNHSRLPTRIPKPKKGRLTVQDAKSLQSVAMEYKNYYKSKSSVVWGQNPMFDDVEDEAEYPASSEQNINPMFRGFEGGGGGGSNHSRLPTRIPKPKKGRGWPEDDAPLTAQQEGGDGSGRSSTNTPFVGASLGGREASPLADQNANAPQLQHLGRDISAGANGFIANTEQTMQRSVAGVEHLAHQVQDAVNDRLAQVVGTEPPGHHADNPNRGFGAPPGEDGIDDASSCEEEGFATIAEEEEEEDADELVWAIKYRDKRSSQLMIDDAGSDERYWQVKVQPPSGTKHAPGDGMLIWFEEGSYVGLPRDKSDGPLNWAGRLRAGGCIGSNIEGETPSLSLWQEGESSIISHGHRLNSEEIKNFRLLENRVKYADGLSGRPGSNLPTASDPLFIPNCSCMLKFSTPVGTGSYFNMGACYTGVTPILLSSGKKRRLFLWTCNVMIYFMKLGICFMADQKIQVIAFAVFCMIALILATDMALGTKAKIVDRREGREQILRDTEAWKQLWSDITSRCCCQASRKAKKVRRVSIRERRRRRSSKRGGLGGEEGPSRDFARVRALERVDSRKEEEGTVKGDDGAGDSGGFFSMPNPLHDGVKDREGAKEGHVPHADEEEAFDAMAAAGLSEEQAHALIDELGHTREGGNLGGGLHLDLTRMYEVLAAHRCMVDFEAATVRAAKAKAKEEKLAKKAKAKADRAKAKAEAKAEAQAEAKAKAQRANLLSSVLSGQVTIEEAGIVDGGSHDNKSDDGNVSSSSEDSSSDDSSSDEDTANDEYTDDDNNDGNGSRTNHHIDQGAAVRLWKQIDANNDGDVSWEEFRDGFGRRLGTALSRDPEHMHTVYSAVKDRMQAVISDL